MKPVQIFSELKTVSETPSPQKYFKITSLHQERSITKAAGDILKINDEKKGPENVISDKHLIHSEKFLNYVHLRRQFGIYSEYRTVSNSNFHSYPPPQVFVVKHDSFCQKPFWNLYKQ